MTKKGRKWTQSLSPLVGVNSDPRVMVRKVSIDNSLEGNGRDNPKESQQQPVEGGMPKYRIWKIPTFSNRSEGLFKHSTKGNKYLLKQYNRIVRALANYENERALKIGLVLFQRSDAYLLYSFNKSLRGWYYTLTADRVRNLLDSITYLRRVLDTNAVYRRVYIPKANGKIRPLGVPDLEGRVILDMIQNMMILLLDREVGDYQYGFRPHRNVGQAGERVLHKIRIEGKELYEFDLEACFNRISMKACFDFVKNMKGSFYPPVLKYLRGLLTCPPIPATVKQETRKFTKWDFIRSLIVLVRDSGTDWLRIRYSFWALYQSLIDGFYTHRKKVGYYIDATEKEMSLVNGGTVWNVKFLKYGFPQGGSLSPLLSIISIESVIRKLGWDTIMYADDGLIFADDRITLLQQLDWDAAIPYGVFPAPGFKKDGTPKCGFVDDVFTFLGLTYSIKRDSFLLDGEGCKYSTDTMNRLKTAYQGGTPRHEYEEIRSPDWTGELRKHSWVYYRYPCFGILNLTNLILYLLGRKDIKRIGSRFIQTSSCSSEACESMGEQFPNARGKNRRVRPVTFESKFNTDELELFVRRAELSTEDFPIDYEGPPIGDLGTFLDLRKNPNTGQWKRDMVLRNHLETLNYGGQILYLDPYDADYQPF